MPPVTPKDGPIAVTGASGYIGAHVVLLALKRGYTVHACVTDANNAAKTEHLLEMTTHGYPGKLVLFSADMTKQGGYDEPFRGCCCVIHVGAPMGYGGVHGPKSIYDGTVYGTQFLVESVKKAGTIKRVVLTSSFAAIGHPAKLGYEFTEKDWATDGQGRNWDFAFENRENPKQNGEPWYQMAKVETEKFLYRTARDDGSFDAATVCPLVVLGPILSKTHNLVGGWHWILARMLRGKECARGWESCWNIVDVRDAAEAHLLIAESPNVKNGSRYQLSAKDDDAIINVHQLVQHLQELFPTINVGGAPAAIKEVEKKGGPFRAPIAYRHKATKELGLGGHNIRDTLKTTGETFIKFGCIQPAYKSGAAKL